MLCPMNRGLFSFAVLFSDPGRYVLTILIFPDFLIQRNYDMEYSVYPLRCFSIVDIIFIP